MFERVPWVVPGTPAYGCVRGTYVDDVPGFLCWLLSSWKAGRQAGREATGLGASASLHTRIESQTFL